MDSDLKKTLEDYTHRHLCSQVRNSSPHLFLIHLKRLQINYFQSQSISFSKKKRQRWGANLGPPKNEMAEAGFELGTFQSQDNHSTMLRLLYSKIILYMQFAAMISLLVLIFYRWRHSSCSLT